MTSREDMYATIGRSSEFDELFAAINYFSVKKVSITITNKSRIDKKNINYLFEKYLSNVELTFLDFDFSKNNANDYKNFLIENTKNIEIYALALTYNRHIYKVSPFLKKQGNTVIQISDGVNNAFSLFGYILGFRSNNFASFLKGMYIFFEYKKAKANFSFYGLFPLKNSFAYKTLPLQKRFKKYPNQIENLINCKTLIVSGWGMSYENLFDFFKLDESITCGSSKGLEIFVQKKRIKIDSSITAEDIIDFGKLERVVGAPSTALIYAKVNYPELQVDCVLTGVLNKTFGLFYEIEYIKLGKKVGVNFYKLNT